MSVYAIILYLHCGELAEWSIATVLKTVDRQRSGGSNPSLSAIFCFPVIVKKLLFTIALLVSSLLAWYFPEYFESVGGYELKRLILPLLQLIMFGMGTTLALSDLAKAVKMPWGIALGALLQFGVMPLLGFLIAKALRLDPDIAAGVILVGSVAGGLASNVMTYIARGNVALSVVMTCVSTLLSPILTPLLMKFYAGRFVPINTLDMSLEIVKMTIVPVAFGLLFRRIFARFFQEKRQLMDNILSFISMFGICFILAVIIAPSKARIKEAGAVILLAAALHNGLGIALGYFGARGLSLLLPGKFSEADCRTIALEVGMQNSGMATELAMNVLKNSAAALAPTIFSVWMDVSTSLLANYWRKKTPAPLRKDGGFC